MERITEQQYRSMSAYVRKLDKKVLVIGHLNREVELRYTPNGIALTDISVVVDCDNG